MIDEIPFFDLQYFNFRPNWHLAGWGDRKPRIFIIKENSRLPAAPYYVIYIFPVTDYTIDLDSLIALGVMSEFAFRCDWILQAP